MRLMLGNRELDWCKSGSDFYDYSFSDARSAQVVDERIRPAVESGSRICSAKPTLVVIDEIDGATSGEHVGYFFYHSVII